MGRTIATPNLIFRARRLRPRFSEQVYVENDLAKDVAEPLFEAGILLAAITERADYDSGMTTADGYYAHHHMLQLHLQGAMHVELNGRTHEMKPGDLMVCPARTRWRCFQGGVPAWWMYFVIDDLPAWEPLKTQDGCIRACEAAPLLFLLLRGILDATASHQPDDIAQARENARALVGLLRVEMNRGAPGRSKQAVALRELVEAVTAKPQGTWDRHTMAARLNVSVSQLKRIFHEELGIGPRELVIRQRINRATALLINGDQKIANIASELGYESLHSFTRLFTQHVGMSPGKYRTRFTHPARPPVRNPRPT